MIHCFQQKLMIDGVEESLDVQIDDPIILPTPLPRRR